jgi:phage terminase Nu1 subunit (DNA packaging protein)
VSSQPVRGVEVGQVASLLNLTPRRVQQLAKEGVIPKAERGRYQIAGCVRGYIAFLQKTAETAQARAAQPVFVDLQKERARKTAAEAELAEIEVAKARGEVVLVADYEAALGTVLDRLTARLRGLPVQLAAAGPEAEALAETEVERIIVELSQFDDDVIDEPAATEDAAA